MSHFYARIRFALTSLMILFLAMGTAVPQARAQTQTEGTIWGTFSVTSRGTASYEMQLQAPPGVRKLQPKLAITYSNGSANGLMGVGFGLQGLPAITRTGANIAQDGFKGGVSYDANDRFSYSGHRLITTQGTPGGDGALYLEERTTWAKFRSHAKTDTGETCGSGPCWWDMVTKQGVIYEFGRSDTARIAVNDGSGTIRVWALNKITDLNGNSLEVSYTQTPFSGATNQGQYYPAQISYGGNDAQGVSHNRFVTFTYEKRPDPVQIFRGGAEVVTDARLTQIDTKAGQTPALSVRVSYGTSDATGRSLVTSLQECSGDGSLCLTPSTFDWQQADLAFDNSGTWLSQDFVTGWDANDKRLLSDVNGDGLIDLVGFRLDSQVALATQSNSFQSAASWNAGFGSNAGWNKRNAPISLADVNGDGLGDVIGFDLTGVKVALSTGTGFDSGVWTQNYPYFGLSTGNGWDASRNPRMMSDVDGDGLSDIVGFGNNGLEVGLSQGTQFAAPTTWNQSDFTSTDWWSAPNRVRLLGDVNGDGLSDVVGFGASGVVVGLSTGRLGNSFDTASWAQNANGYPYFSNAQGWQTSIHPRLLADVNGDGLADIVGFRQGTQVALSTGTGFLPPVVWNPGFSIESLPAYDSKNTRLLVDVNGDGLPDILGLTSTGIEVALNQTNAFAAGNWDQSSGADFTSNTGKLTSAGDVNGDGLNDFVAFGAATSAPTGVNIGLAKGVQDTTRGDLMTKVTNGLGGEINITYAPMTDPETYTPGPVGTGSGLAFFASVAPQSYSAEAAQYPIQNVVGGKVFLVKTVTETSASPVPAVQYSYRTHYSYTDAKLDMLSGRWLGFASKTRLYTNDGKQTTETFSQAYPLNGETLTRAVTCASGATDPKCTPGALMTEAGFTYDAPQVASGTGRLTPPVYDVNRASHQVNYFTYGTWNNAHKFTYGYDSFGNVISQMDLADVAQNGTDLNSSDNLLICKDYVNVTGSGFAWQLGYLQNLKRTRANTCSNLETFTPGRDLTLSARSYDTASGRMNLLTDARWDDQAATNLTYTYSYDGFGNPVAHTNPQGFTATTSYDDTYHTFVTQQANPPLSGENGLVIAIDFQHDPRFGVEIARVDANQDASTTCLDGLGRTIATQEQQHDASVVTDQNCVSSGIGASNPVVTVTKSTWDRSASGEIYTQVENLLNWPTASAPAEFLYQQNYMDGRARVYKAVTEGVTASTDKVQCVVYDGYNRRPFTSYPFLGQASADCSHPGDAANWQEKDYDILGRIIERRRPNASDASRIVTDTTGYPTYLSADQTLATGSAQPYQRSFAYRMINGKRQLVEIVAANDNNATTTINRDLMGQIIETIAPATSADPSGIATQYTLDSLGRKVKIDTPDRGTIAYDYAGTQYVATITDGLGTQTNTYDEMGRITQRLFPNGDKKSWIYDQNSAANGIGRVTHSLMNLAAGSDEDAQETFGYDAQGNISEYALTLGAGSSAVAYTSIRSFGPQRHLLAVQTPGQDTIAYSYQKGHLASASLNGQALLAFSDYDPFDVANTVTFDAGAVTETRTNGPTGLMVHQSVNGANGTYLDRNLSWSDLQELQGIQDQAQYDGHDLSETYDYTTLRLTAASGPYGTRSYQYDPAGNIVSADDGSAAVDFSYQNFQLQTGVTNGATVLRLAYDDVGSTVSRQAGSDTWDYSYNDQRKLISANRNAAPVASYGYDANNRRIVKKDAVTGLTTIYVDANYQVTTDAQGNQLATVLVNGPDGVAVTHTTGSPAIRVPGVPVPGRLNLHRNHVQSVVLTTDSAGDVAGLFSYAPFGELSLIAGNDDVRPKFTGKELDSTGLYHFEARQLDPSTGRFLTADTGPSAPLTVQDSLNTYAYVAGRPTSLTDPSGKQIFGAIAAVTAEVATEVGAATATAAEGAAVAGEVGAAAGEATAASSATTLSAETAMSAEAIGTTSANATEAIEASASTAARTATLDAEALSATTVSSGEIAAGQSATEIGSLTDSTAFEGETSLTTCSSPCTGGRLLQRAYRVWAERPVMLYRAIRNVDEINLLETDNLLQSPATRAGLDVRVPDNMFSRFAMRFWHSLDSTGSAYVSTTYDQNVAEFFARGGGRIYQFEVPRGQLYWTWHSPFFEAEYLAEDGTQVSNLVRLR